MTAPTRLCIDCACYIPERAGCGSEQNQQVDYVSGGTRPIYMMAQACRIYDNACGSAAKWFEAKVTNISEAR